jgi:AraC-like DNA-binding protein
MSCAAITCSATLPCSLLVMIVSVWPAESWFQQVEGMPLYRYQLRLRLARAFDLLGQYDNLSSLGLDLGICSHSHFSAAFRQAYGRTPLEFQRSARLRCR